MVAQLKMIKATLLAGLILVGLGVQCSRATAADGANLTVAGVHDVVSGYTGDAPKISIARAVAPIS